MSQVLVTGANGFIGQWIVRTLLERGHSVVGTVRSEAKTIQLRKLFEDTENLKFSVVPDMTTPDAFDETIKTYKFDAVIHNSSPFNFALTDVVKDFYEPAIKGTTGILKSIRAHGPSVKRVVVLSSFAAVCDRSKGNRPGYAYTDKDWNPVTWETGLENTSVGYWASKKLAEQAAWDFVEKEKPHFTLTTLCPPMVHGPPEEVISINNLGASVAEIYSYFNGTREPVNRVWLWVDVRHIALANVLAIEKDAAANQRYIISQGRYSAQWFSEYAWKYFPERATVKGIPKPGPLFPPEGTYTVDSSKSIRDLGISYRGFEEMIVDTYKKLEELEMQ